MTVRFFTRAASKETLEEVSAISHTELFKESYIAVLPNAVAKGGNLTGFSTTFNPKAIAPKLLGPNIGCGVAVWDLGPGITSTKIAYIDYILHHHEPIMQDRDAVSLLFRSNRSKLNFILDLQKVCLRLGFSTGNALYELGLLGYSKNHFAKLFLNPENNHIYLAIHSGSYRLGVAIYSHYEKRAKQYLNTWKKQQRRFREEQVKEEYQDDREALITAIRNIPRPYNKPFLEGIPAIRYIDSCKIAQKYAQISRRYLGYRILKALDLAYEDPKVEAMHTFLDDNNNLLRRGAVSAQKGEQTAILLGPEEGIAIGVGTGNGLWNYSAPSSLNHISEISHIKDTINVEHILTAIK